jgi:hypothetical protein
VQRTTQQADRAQEVGTSRHGLRRTTWPCRPCTLRLVSDHLIASPVSLSLSLQWPRRASLLPLHAIAPACSCQWTRQEQIFFSLSSSLGVVFRHRVRATAFGRDPGATVFDPNSTRLALSQGLAWLARWLRCTDQGHRGDQDKVVVVFVEGQVPPLLLHCRATDRGTWRGRFGQGRTCKPHTCVSVCAPCSACSLGLSRLFSASQQYFSLSINQLTVFLTAYFQLNEQAAVL